MTPDRAARLSVYELHICRYVASVRRTQQLLRAKLARHEINSIIARLADEAAP